MKNLLFFLVLLISITGCEKLEWSKDDCGCLESNNESYKKIGSTSGQSSELSGGTAANSTSEFIGPIHWHDLPQEDRNKCILDYAYRDLGNDVHKECKEWVRSVVQGISSGCSNIPATNSSNWYWDYSKYVKKCGAIDQANPGEIIQIRLKNGGPHTAIISGVVIEDNNNSRTVYITFIESNWCRENFVCERTITMEEFSRQVMAYTIYRVL